MNEEEIKKFKEMFEEKFTKDIKPTKASEDIHEAIMTFNEELHSKKYPAEECYKRLYEKKNNIEYEFYKKHGFYMDMGFSFLYPEIIDLSSILKELKKDKENE